VLKRGAEGLGPLWNLKFLAKIVVFLVLSGKKQILIIFVPLEKLKKNPLNAPLGKILSTPMSVKLVFQHYKL